MTAEAVKLRQPVSEDGASVHSLIAACPPLDPNSIYCNLLQCSHFSATSVAAEVENELMGFVSGYLLPERNDTLFIWQVAVGEKGRGCGLATQMLQHLLDRPVCERVTYLETTITESNQASWRLFERLAKTFSAEIKRTVMFDRDRHFNGRHDSETLVRIGPFNLATHN